MAQGALRFRGIDPFTRAVARFWVSSMGGSCRPRRVGRTAVDGGWIVRAGRRAQSCRDRSGLDVTIEQARQSAYADAKPGPC